MKKGVDRIFLAESVRKMPQMKIKMNFSTLENKKWQNIDRENLNIFVS